MKEVAKTYLMNITTAGAELPDDSWIEHINQDCTTDTSGPSNPTSLSPYEKIKIPFLQMTSSQTETDLCCLALSPRITKPVCAGKGTPAGLCESCWGSKRHCKRGKLEYNPLDMVVQNFPRSNLLECLDTYCETLKVEGTFATQSRQVFT